MRNVSEKLVKKYQNTHFVFNDFFPLKTVAFIRKYERIYYSQAGQR